MHALLPASKVFAVAASLAVFVLWILFSGAAPSQNMAGDQNAKLPRRSVQADDKASPQDSGPIESESSRSSQDSDDSDPSSNPNPVLDAPLESPTPDTVGVGRKPRHTRQPGVKSCDETSSDDDTEDVLARAGSDDREGADQLSSGATSNSSSSAHKVVADESCTPDQSYRSIDDDNVDCSDSDEDETAFSEEYFGFVTCTPSRNYGFIRCENKRAFDSDIFFHMSSVEAGDRLQRVGPAVSPRRLGRDSYASIEPGDRVSFNISQSRWDVRAVAVNIRVVAKSSRQQAAEYMLRSQQSGGSEDPVGRRVGQSIGRLPRLQVGPRASFGRKHSRYTDPASPFRHNSGVRSREIIDDAPPGLERPVNSAAATSDDSELTTRDRDYFWKRGIVTNDNVAVNPEDDAGPALHHSQPDPTRVSKPWSKKKRVPRHHGGPHGPHGTHGHAAARAMPNPLERAAPPSFPQYYHNARRGQPRHAPRSARGWQAHPSERGPHQNGMASSTERRNIRRSKSDIGPNSQGRSWGNIRRQTTMH